MNLLETVYYVEILNQFRLKMLRQEYDLRVEEIEQYFDFLKEIEENKWIQLVNEDLSKILKANGFLLLYNLIESCIYFSIIEIFEEINNQEKKYIDVIPKIKNFWLRTKFKNQEEQTHQSISQKFYNYIDEIINGSILLLEIEKIDYGGTLTPAKIRQLAKELGLDFKEETYKEYPNGKAMTDIKDKRNDLAHGKFSFGQVGRDLTYAGTVKFIGEDMKIIKFGLVHYKEFAILHLSEFITSVEIYLQNKSYKLENP